MIHTSELLSNSKQKHTHTHLTCPAEVTTFSQNSQSHPLNVRLHYVRQARPKNAYDNPLTHAATEPLGNGLILYIDGTCTAHAKTKNTR